MKKNRGIKIAKILLKTYRKSGIFNKKPPEEVIPNGIKRRSREHLLFLTLTVSLDYIRNAEKLWKSARETYEDQQTRYLFEPKEVIKKDLFELQKDMQKYKLALRPNKDSRIWKTLCETLYSEFESNPSRIIEEYKYDAKILYKFIKENEKKFPHLKGKKILPLWLRMLKMQVGIKLKNIDKIEIPVDTHIRRSTKMLKIVSEDANDEDIKKTWSVILEGTKIHPIFLDEPLWILSKYGCSKVKNNECPQIVNCPVREFCKINEKKLPLR